MKYFGTDGIRMLTEKFLEDSFSERLAKALCSAFSVKRVIIARDSRMGGDKITAMLEKGLKEYGVEVLDLGIIPTPAVAYYTVCERADFGIMISASHNPPEYNGIKIFSKKGIKISAKEEEEIEYYLENGFKKFTPMSSSVKSIDGTSSYVTYIFDKIENKIEKKYKGIKILLDTACGATCIAAPAVFRGLGAKAVDVVNGKFDGTKINVDCGSTNIESLVVDKKYFIALAFDGDGDRVLAKTPKGRIIDGDAIMYVLALYLKVKGKLNKDTVVGTVLTNSALEDKLSEFGISLVRTNVGDKYIQKEMIDNGLSLGAEQSGHIILDGTVKTGDGILVGALLVQALLELKIDPDRLDYYPYPQASISVPCEDKGEELCQKEELLNFVDDCKNQGFRIILRPSGTEPIVRLMAEGKDYDKLVQILKEGEELIKNLYESIKA